MLLECADTPSLFKCHPFVEQHGHRSSSEQGPVPLNASLTYSQDKQVKKNVTS